MLRPLRSPAALTGASCLSCPLTPYRDLKGKVQDTPGDQGEIMKENRVKPSPMTSKQVHSDKGYSRSNQEVNLHVRIQNSGVQAQL